MEYLTPEMIEAASALFCLTVVGGIALGLLALVLGGAMGGE